MNLYRDLQRVDIKMAVRSLTVCDSTWPNCYYYCYWWCKCKQMDNKLRRSGSMVQREREDEIRISYLSASLTQMGRVFFLPPERRPLHGQRRRMVENHLIQFSKNGMGCASHNAPLNAKAMLSAKWLKNEWHQNVNIFELIRCVSFRFNKFAFATNQL